MPTVPKSPRRAGNAKRRGYRAALGRVLLCAALLGATGPGATSRAQTRDADVPARGPSAERIAGASLGAFGAAAAIGAGVGSLSYLLKRQHSGAWGWVNVLAGALLVGGGVLLVDHGGRATQVGGHLALVGGVLSVGTGVAGLSLQRPEAQAPFLRRWRIRPSWLWSGAPGAGGLPGLVWHGVL